MKQQTKTKQRSKTSQHLLLLVFLAVVAFLASILISGQSLSTYFQQLGESLAQMYGKDDRYLWLLKGVQNTLIITVLAVLLGTAIGLVLSLIRVMYQAGARISFLNTLANLYITIIRGTPVTVQLLIIYFGIFASVDVNTILAAALAFGLNSGAYVAEIFRAGIESVDRGQMEAGRSLGLTYLQTMRKIILPQAVKNVLPTMFNECIALLKETAVAGYVGVTDLTRAANEIRSKTWSQSPLYVSALLYLIIVLGLTACLRQLERRMKKSDRR